MSTLSPTQCGSGPLAADRCSPSRVARLQQAEACTPYSGRSPSPKCGRGPLAADCPPQRTAWALAILFLLSLSLHAADPAPTLLLHFTFDEPITGDGQAIASELAEPIPCKWGRAVSGFATLSTAKDGQPWSSDQYVPGRIGHAYAFGGNDAKQWLRVPMTPEIDLDSDDFTFAFWFKAHDTLAGTFFVRTTTAPYLMLGQQGDGRLRLAIRSEESKATGVAVSKAALNDGAWHHVAFTADRDGMGTFWIDGRPDAETNIRGNAGNLSKPYHLGIGGFGYATGYLHGLLDDFRLYRGLLTPTQIFALANPPQQ